MPPNTEASMETISEVISSFQQNPSMSDNAPLVSPFQIYQLGLILHDLQQHHDDNLDGEESPFLLLKERYHNLIKQLPASYLENVVFCDLNQAFMKTNDVTSSKDNEIHKLAAVKSLCSLYHCSSLACRMGFTTQICQIMANVYDEMKQNETRQQQINHNKDGGNRSNDNDDTNTIVKVLFQGLSSLLVDGLCLSTKYASDPETHLQSIMEVVQALTTDEESTCLGDLQEWQREHREQPLLQDVVRSKFYPQDGDTSQCEYLIQMLQSSPTWQDKQSAVTAASAKLRHPANTTTNTKKMSSSKNTMSALDRGIQQVREVFPDLGEGYIETALSCYKGDVSQTLSSLLEGQSNPQSLHPTLQVMDTTLPKRRPQNLKSNTTNYTLDDEDAKRITKSQVTQMEKQEEEAAYALSIMQQTQSNNNEYNDDYDDQYDGNEGGGGGGMAGGTDVGMYDIDFDTIKKYNKMARETEQEDSFWDDMRNTNRKSNNNAKKKSEQKDDEEGEEGEKTKKFRGPDKGKGGRAIGPDGRYLPIQKGGKKAKQRRQNQNQNQNDNTNNATANNNNNNSNSKTSGSNTKQQQQQQKGKNKDTAPGGGDGTSGNLSKIQKRRKNDNKAKVANHHRKERAQKKTGGF